MNCLTVTAEFVTGEYAASDGSSSVPWPPDPLRLLGALVAANRGIDSPALRAFESAEPPLIYAMDHSRLIPRRTPAKYAVSVAKKQGSAVGLPGRMGQQLEPEKSLLLPPGRNRVVYYWESGFDTGTVVELVRLCEKVGYLGQSRSAVALSAQGNPPDDTICTGLTVWRPCEEPRLGATLVNIPNSGKSLRAWDTHHKQQADRGHYAQRAEIAGLRTPIWYAPESSSPLPGLPVQAAAWLRFDNPAPARWTVRVAEAVRGAFLSAWQRNAGRQPPAWATSHANTGARNEPRPLFVPLPSVGSEHSDGAIRGAAILIPRSGCGVPESDLAEAIGAANTIDRIWTGDWSASAEVASDGEPPAASQPRTWLSPSKRWLTATPVVYPQHPGKREPLAQAVQRWLADFSGLEQAEVVAAHASRHSWLRGGASLGPDETLTVSDRERGAGAGRWAHMEIEFDREVAGLLVFGRKASYGLGLCLPIQGS